MDTENYLEAPEEDRSVVFRRIAAYWLAGLGLTAGLLLAHGTNWQGGAQLHTVMEGMATLLAAMVGAMALVRYYSKMDSIFLFIGAGFLGTAFLDGYHAVVTSLYFKPFMPSDQPSLIPWSWVASRQFLSVLMFLSWLAWLRERRYGEAGRISEKSVYLGTAAFTLASFLFFAFVPLRRAYYPEFFLHRPEELAPALFFLLALIGYLRKGNWRREYFEHWLVLSLIIGFVSQAVFMSHSGRLFDLEFDIAHLLKKVTYVCVLIGLMISMHVIFRRENLARREISDSHKRLSAIFDTVPDGIVTIDKRGIIQSVNPAAARLFGYSQDELIGRNVSKLVSEPHRGVHDGYIERYLATGEKRVIGNTRELEGQRKNGDLFPLELSVAEVRLAEELLFLGVTRDITERHEMDRMKDEFVSTVSHELRTPLTVILGYLPMLTEAENLPQPKMIAQMADRMETSGQHLLAIVNDLLDVTRIEGGKLRLERSQLPAAEMVSSVVRQLHPKADEKQLTLEARIAECPVYADQTRLRQILINLIGNALKFTESGRVEVSVSADNGFTLFKVSDTGCGIPEDQLEKVFDRLQQVNGTSTRDKGGAGLGLAISRSLVEMHGGTISVSSRVGVGTTFAFTIPSAPDEAAGND